MGNASEIMMCRVNSMVIEYKSASSPLYDRELDARLHVPRGSSPPTIELQTWWNGPERRSGVWMRLTEPDEIEALADMLRDGAAAIRAYRANEPPTATED